MQQDQEDKKKLEKGQERITHKIAKDLEQADRKRKAEDLQKRSGLSADSQGEKRQQRSQENHTSRHWMQTNKGVQ